VLGTVGGLFDTVRSREWRYELASTHRQKVIDLGQVARDLTKGRPQRRDLTHHGARGDPGNVGRFRKGRGHVLDLMGRLPDGDIEGVEGTIGAAPISGRVPIVVDVRLRVAGGERGRRPRGAGTTVLDDIPCIPTKEVVAVGAGIGHVRRAQGRRDDPTTDVLAI